MPRQTHRLSTWDKLILYVLDKLSRRNGSVDCMQWFTVRMVATAVQQQLHDSDIALRISRRGNKITEDSVRACLNKLTKALVVLKTWREFPANRLNRYSRMYNCYSFPGYGVVSVLRCAVRNEVTDFRCLDCYNIGTQVAYDGVRDWFEPIRSRHLDEQHTPNGFLALSRRCSEHSLEEIYAE